MKSFLTRKQDDTEQNDPLNANHNDQCDIILEPAIGIFLVVGSIFTTLWAAINLCNGGSQQKSLVAFGSVAFIWLIVAISRKINTLCTSRGSHTLLSYQ